MGLDLLDAGVYVWLQDGAGFGRANAGLVVDGDGITLIDTLMVPSQFDPFGEVVDGLGMPIPRAVLTSSHIEFVGGTARFRLPGVYARRQVSAHLDQPADPAVYRALMPDFAHEFADDLRTRPVTHIVDTDVQLTPAVTLLCTSGELEENIVALVPGAQVLFAGAMCSFGVTPLCFQGDPGRWADELDRITEMAPIIVPGHGPIGGEEEVRDLQAYLRACVAADGDERSIPSGPWDAWVDRAHDRVNVERAAMLARGDSSIPPSMLELAGLA